VWYTGLSNDKFGKELRAQNQPMWARENPKSKAEPKPTASTHSPYMYSPCSRLRGSAGSRPACLVRNGTCRRHRAAGSSVKGGAKKSTPRRAGGKVAGSEAGAGIWGIAAAAGDDGDGGGDGDGAGRLAASAVEAAAAAGTANVQRRRGAAAGAGAGRGDARQQVTAATGRRALGAPPPHHRLLGVDASMLSNAVGAPEWN